MLLPYTRARTFNARACARADGSIGSIAPLAGVMRALEGEREASMPQSVDTYG